MQYIVKQQSENERIQANTLQSVTDADKEPIIIMAFKSDSQQKDSICHRINQTGGCDSEKH